MDYEILERFNNRFSKIENHKFIKLIEESQTRETNIKYENYENWIPDTIDRDILDSYSLHFRILIQTKDGISIVQIFNFYNSLDTEFNEYKKEMKDIEKILNDFLNKKTILSGYSYNELFKLCFYGGLAHENEDKYKNFEKIFNNSGNIGQFFFFEFLNVLYKYHEIMRVIKLFNIDLLNNLKNKK